MLEDRIRESSLGGCTFRNCPSLDDCYLFSTGLLVLVPTEITQERNDFQLKSEFKLKEDIAKSTRWAPGISSAVLYYGLHGLNLSYPLGTSDDTVTPDIQPPAMPFKILDYNVSTEALKVNFECEILPIDMARVPKVDMPLDPAVPAAPSFFSPDPEQVQIFATDIETSECTIKGAYLGSVPLGYEKSPSYREYLYQRSFDWYTCDNRRNVSYENTFEPIMNSGAVVESTSRDVRLILAATFSTFEKGNSTRSNNTSQNGNWKISKGTAAICKPSYFIARFDIHKSNVLNGSTQAKPSNGLEQPPRQFQEFSEGTLGIAVWASTLTYATYGWRECKGFFGLMAMKSGQPNCRLFLDPQLLIRTAADVFKGVATQLMHQIALQPTSKNVTGYVTYMDHRIRTTLPSTIFLCFSFFTLTILCVSIYLIQPRFDASVSPETIVSVAKLLSDSQHENVRSSIEPPRENTIGSRTKSKSWLPKDWADETKSPLRHNSENHKIRRNPFSMGNSESAKDWWWAPMAGNTYYFVLAVGLPVAAIILLELLQHLCQRNAGIMYQNYAAQLALATYGATIAALSISAIYSSFEFTAKLAMPFIVLKRGRGSTLTVQSLRLNLLGKLLPVSLYHSIKSHQYPIVSATFGSLIGGFLTIVISGLYTNIDSPLSQQITIFEKDIINVNITKRGYEILKQHIKILYSTV
ncbi:hypothetical protein HJFPF1_13322 [Paramyrothecium foliicola]|nr:hypothetical protein HJFPF1_13322 [Paramyrothecium foliicola]